MCATRKKLQQCRHTERVNGNGFVPRDIWTMKRRELKKGHTVCAVRKKSHRRKGSEKHIKLMLQLKNYCSADIENYNNNTAAKLNK